MPRHPNNTNKIITDDQFIVILRFINKRYSRQLPLRRDIRYSKFQSFVKLAEETKLTYNLLYSAMISRDSIPSEIHSRILMFCGVEQG